MSMRWIFNTKRLLFLAVREELALACLRSASCDAELGRENLMMKAATCNGTRYGGLCDEEASLLCQIDADFLVNLQLLRVPFELDCSC